MFEKIKKRDQRIVEFDSSKITEAILKAGKATGEFGERDAKKLTMKVLTLAHEIRLDPIPEVEEIQDIVERILLDSPYYKTAKAYILYREQHAQIRKIATKAGIDLVEHYLQKLDWKVKENSNMCYSLQGLNNYISSDVTSEYWLNRIYPPEVRQLHKNGDIHIHDLSLLSVYCVGWDLQDLLLQGFKGVAGKVESAPPKHLRTALGQLVNFFYTLQGEAAGAQAVSNFDTLLAPFIRYDNLRYDEVKQAMQEFVFNINIPTRVGFQCMSEDTEILTPKGWIGYKDLKIGQLIKTFNIKTGKIEDLPVKKVFSKYYEGEMYNLKNRIQDQLISPGHRIVRKKFNTKDSFVLEEIEKVLEYKTPPIIPVPGKNNEQIIEFTQIQSIEKVNYSGIIWCPNTDNETVIAKRNGKVFITGNTPFTNITMDLDIPSTLKDNPVIIGGKYQNETYSKFQPEMDMLNKAFAEIMMEGDASGRVFSLHPDEKVVIYNQDNERIIIDKIGSIIDKRLSEEGALDVSDLNYKALSFNTETLKTEFKTITRFIKHKEDNTCVKVKTHVGNEVIVTKGHSLFVFTPEGEVIHKPVNDMKQGDFIVSAKRFQVDKFKENIKLPLDFGKDESVKNVFPLWKYIRDNIIKKNNWQVGDFDRYKRDNISLEKLKDLYQELKERAALENLELQDELLDKIINGDLFLERIVSIENFKYSGYVYDFSVEDNESFIGANSVVFHNTFPIPTYNITKDFDWDNSNLDRVWDMTGKYGIPYFCLEENTPVLKDDYTVTSISSLAVGDRLLDEHGKAIEITAVLSQEVEDTIHIDLEDGEKIIATPSHRFPTQEGVKSAQELCLLDKLQQLSLPAIRFHNDEQEIQFVNIKRLLKISGKYKVVDISVDSPTHLFVLGNGIISHNSNFVNSDMSPEDTRSMCPLHPDTKVVIRTSGRGMSIRTIKDVYYTHLQKGTEYEVLFNGKWHKAGLVATQSEGCVELSIGNGQQVTMDLRHEQPIKQGKGKPIEIVQAKNIVSGMYVPFNAVPLSDEYENYEAGFVVAYGKYYFYEDGYWWFPIEYIRPMTGYNNMVFCFTVDSDEHLFQLANGMVTHNCRLRLDHRELRKRGGGLFGANPLTGCYDEETEILTEDGWKYFKDLSENDPVFTLSENNEIELHKPERLFEYDYDGEMFNFKAKSLDLCVTPNHRMVIDRINRGNHKRGFVEAKDFDVNSHRIPLIDNVQELIAKIKNEKLETYSTSSENLKYHQIRKDNISKKHYVGKVYCCEVKNNTVLVRRNGKVTWCGNSIGVVTVNMPRVGYLAKDEKDFLNRTKEHIETAEKSLSIKRKILEQFTEKNLYPYSKFYLRNIKQQTGCYWKNHFSTIGIIGMNEACLNFLGSDIGTETGRNFAIRVMDFIRDILSEMQDRTGEIFNLEATPAEGTTYRLALLDKKQFPDIICANELEYKKGADPFYTNSTHLPVNYSDDIVETLELQDELQTRYTGGTVAHIYLGEQINDIQITKNLVKKVANNFRLPYFTLSPTFSVCPSHGYLKGNQARCPYCNAETEVYSRVVGYLRPVKQWNNGKQEEFYMRKTFKAA
ncbi:ribonucleoside-triphosphate reductase (formate) [Candidatus Magnetomoraceae bacterium gMMP-15]